MSLDKDDITNLERGIDAAIDVLLGMAQTSMARVTVEHGAELAGPFVGFLQALVEHRQALAYKSLEKALLDHPEEIEEEEPDATAG